MFLSEWREFPSAPCLAGKKKNLMIARVSMLLKSRASLTCFRASFLPGWAKDLSAPRYTQFFDRWNLVFGLDQYIYTRWFKYDRDWLRIVYTQISPGHIWTTLYMYMYVYIYIYMYISTKHTKLLSKDTLLYFKFVRLVSACKPFSGSSYKHLQVVPNCYGLLKFRYTYYQLRLHCALIWNLNAGSFATGCSRLYEENKMAS